MRLVAKLFGSAVLATSLILSPAGAGAGDPAPDALTPDWQDVIGRQIEAFRQKDAPSALHLAGAAFRTAFPSPETFFQSTLLSGYLPIIDSRSHNFGGYGRFGRMVVQEVLIIGNNQAIYEAFFEMEEEPQGWRIQGVKLVKRDGIGI